MGYEVRLRSAQIVGRSHLIAGKNRQDAIKVASLDTGGEVIHYSVICDGCSEGVSSEVGASLTAAFMARQIEVLVKSKIPIEKVPAILHKRTVGFLKEILGRITFDTPSSRVGFIKDNLLFTILGFIHTDTASVVFAQGDGVVVVDDVLTIRDENNMPRYIGYNLVERKYLSSDASPIQTVFDTHWLSGKTFSRLAIASDALGEEPDFLCDLWGHESKFGLQRKVNVWSLVNHKFQDDLSIATLEKVPKEE